MADRQRRVARIMDHHDNPRHYGELAEPDVVMPGGSPECGGNITVFLRGDPEDTERFSGLSFRGEGDTLTLAAASLLLDLIHDRELTLGEIMELEPATLLDLVGREVVGRRERNVTMSLGTLHNAVRAYQRQQRRSAVEAEEIESGAAVCKTG